MDNTFANYAEANRGFWRQTVLPLAGRTAQSLAHWLGPAWEGGWEGAPPGGGPSSGAARQLLPTRGEKGGSGGPLRLVPDLDRVDALASERRDLWSRIGAAGFLTDDEKRAAVGYGAKGGDPGEKAIDIVVTPRRHWENQPRVPAGNSEGGQWTAFLGGLGSLATGTLAAIANISSSAVTAGFGEILKDLLQDVLNRPDPAGGVAPSPRLIRTAGSGENFKSSKDILYPGGRRLGERLTGAATVRTLNKLDFAELKRQLMEGAEPEVAYPGYNGQVYRRPDGLIFGVRQSRISGETVDIIFDPFSDKNMKVHQR